MLVKWCTISWRTLCNCALPMSAGVPPSHHPRSSSMKSVLSALLLGVLVVASAPQVRAASAEKAQAAALQAPPKVFSAPQKEGTKATCPVTGEQFAIAKDTLHAEHKGKHV